jgi:hypothetical protein
LEKTWQEQEQGQPQSAVHANKESRLERTAIVPALLMMLSMDRVAAMVCSGETAAGKKDDTILPRVENMRCVGEQYYRAGVGL